MKKICRLSLHLSYLILSIITVSLFLPHFVTDILAQSPPQSSIKDQNIVVSLNANDAIFNANTSEFLGSKTCRLRLIKLQRNILLITGF